MESAMKLIEASPASGQRARYGWVRRVLHQRWFIAIRAFAVFTALWYAMYFWNGNPLQLPSPFAVASALWDLAAGGEMLEHASISASRLLAALCISIVLAVPLGFWMGLSRTVEAYFDPLVELLRPISGIAWLPLALFIFGIGNTLPVFIMVYVGFFPILLNTIAGVRGVDRKLVAALASHAPSYSAAPCPATHSRHYMPLGGSDGKTTLVLDTCAVPGTKPLTVSWPVDLDEACLELLNRIVAAMGSDTGSRASLRLSIGAETTDQQIDRAAMIVTDAIQRLRMPT